MSFERIMGVDVIDDINRVFTLEFPGKKVTEFSFQVRIISQCEINTSIIR